MPNQKNPPNLTISASNLVIEHETVSCELRVRVRALSPNSAEYVASKVQEYCEGLFKALAKTA